jgi:hypothetical protein
VRSITDIDGHVLADGGAGHLWFNERKPDDTFSGWQPLGVPPLDAANADFPGDEWGLRPSDACLRHHRTALEPGTLTCHRR